MSATNDRLHVGPEAIESLKIEHFYGIPENRKKSRKIYVGDQGKQCCRVGRYVEEVQKR